METNFGDKKLELHGFFSTGEYETKTSECEKCRLYKKCLSPKMPVGGKGRKRILEIAEGPGKTEDQENDQLVGDAGHFFQEKLRPYGLVLNRDFWKDNAVRCRPSNTKGENRPPSIDEIACCKPNIDQTIKELKPKFIWLMGDAAVKSYTMGRFKQDEIATWRGFCIPDRKLNAWVTVLYHPSYAMRNSKNPIIQATYDRDLEFAVSCLEREEVSF